MAIAVVGKCTLFRVFFFCFFQGFHCILFSLGGGGGGRVGYIPVFVVRSGHICIASFTVHVQVADMADVESAREALTEREMELREAREALGEKEREAREALGEKERELREAREALGEEREAREALGEKERELREVREALGEKERQLKEVELRLLSTTQEMTKNAGDFAERMREKEEQLEQYKVRVTG